MRFRRAVLRGAFLPAVLALAVEAGSATVHPSTVARGVLSSVEEHPSTGARDALGSVEGQMPDVDGRPLNPFQPAGLANVIFFVATDCPVSNSYAPEIQRVCREYGSRGVSCSLIYEDVDTAPSGTRLDDEVRKHLQEYRYADIPAAIDRSRAIARRAKTSITPQAVVIDRTGEIRYRGRIDNFYAALGKPRQQVTERDLRNALDAVLSGRPVPKVETEALGCYIVDPALLRK
jgi:thiol-disulfide isomerase/thioredoxin